MAIINCPACGKRISSVAESCEYCKADFNADVDNEEFLRSARKTRLAKKQRLQNISFLFIVLFTAGALIMYMGMSDQNELFNTSGRIMVALGFVGYVVTRVWLMINNRK